MHDHHVICHVIVNRTSNDQPMIAQRSGSSPTRRHSWCRRSAKSHPDSWSLLFSCILAVVWVQGREGGVTCFQHRPAARHDARRVGPAARWELYSRDPSTIRYEVTQPTTLGPPIETKPDYGRIYGPFGPFWDNVFLSLFRTALAENAGFDSDRPGYDGVIDIACRMNKVYGREDVQKRALQVLVTLFPSWMPPAYSVLFSKPFPAFSSRMNAWATLVAGTWLMGECELNDIEIPVQEHGENGGAEVATQVGKNQGLLVKRCRFLEEAGCASVCVHSCKIPTQTFFRENMGLPLLMEPNYETFECQFSFGIAPTLETERAAMSTPCLARCPSSQASRRVLRAPPARLEELSINEGDSREDTSQCNLMEDVPL